METTQLKSNRSYGESVEINENQWTVEKTNENQWKSMRIDANQCSAMKTVKRHRESMQIKDPLPPQKKTRKRTIENADN